MNEKLEKLNRQKAAAGSVKEFSQIGLQFLG